LPKNPNDTPQFIVISCIYANGSDIFVGTWINGIFLSTNNGTSWIAVKNGLPTDTPYDPTRYLGINCIAACSGNLFTGTYGGGAYISTNNGTKWIAANNGLPKDPYNLDRYAGINCLLTIGSNIFAGTYWCGVFLSTNNGTSWTEFNTGLTNTTIKFLAVLGTNLFAGTDRGVWRRSLSDVTTDVEIEQKYPHRFVLDQNYPNAFNPTTKIGFGIPASPNPSKGGALVTLKVYDVLGNEVKTLINKEMEAGYHSIELNASDLPSGVYFYQLRAGSFIETRKMMLLR
jgi:hypothetical protein